MSLLSAPAAGKRKKLLAGFAALVVVVLITLGIFGKNGWLPSTDPLSGKKTGWFGKPLAKNASSSWNPLAAPLPTPTPQLSKEYIWAGGSRLLAVEDANANAAPPADLAVWRPSNGVWFVMGGTGSQATTYPWGAEDDFPVPGDFDGDGKTDFSVFRESDGGWYYVASSTGVQTGFGFGMVDDKPAAADFDGDGRTDFAVYRKDSPSAGYGTWFIWRSSTQDMIGLQWGASDDVPAPADYDGDGKADLSVWRSGDPAFHTLLSSSGTYQGVSMSSAGTQVSADYDGDGKADYAVKNGATWTIRKSSDLSTYSVTPSGDLAADKAVQNDYDGDGKVDIAVWRDSTGNWYIRQSATNTLRQEQWGQSLDIPVPAFYRR